MKSALFIPVEGEPSLVDIPDSGDGELQELQRLVGGWIEYVPTEQPITLYCNEEGKIEGLPLNPRATLHFSGLLQVGDYLAGDVVVLGPIDEHGENTGIDPSWLQAVAS
jgi:hypothetical protein